MNSEKNLNCLVSILLSTCIAAGAVGCMVTGLKLNVSDLHGIVMVCFLCAVASSFCYRFRYGGWALRLMTLAGVIWFLQDPERLAILLEQARVIANRMTTLWNHAYGWHVISLRAQRICDQPMMIVGGFIAIVVSRTVCRQKRAVFPLLVSLCPLMSCLVVTDTVPALPWLFLLLLGLSVLLLTNSLRRSDLRQGLELTGMATVASAAALALLFFLCPRSNYVNQTSEIRGHLFNLAQELPASVKEWGQQILNEDIQTIQPQRENLDTLGDRIERGYTVLEVTAPYDGILYLRGQDFDSYDGKAWTATRNRSEGFNLPNREPVLWEDRRSQITISTRTAKDVRYVPYYPQAQTTMVGGNVSNDEHLLTYSFLQQQLREDWQEVLAYSSTYIPQDDSVYITSGMYDPAKDIWRYRTLPLETKEKAQALLEAILTGEETTTAQKAEAIRAYVQNSATYSLTPEKMPADAGDFALWFLEESDSGYCIHFATAAAVLLRAAGIDARYVTGYALKTVAAQTVAVPASQAHAWVEYYEPAIDAWIPLEATPPDLLFGDPTLVTEPETLPGEDVTLDITTPTEPPTEAPPETEAPTEASAPEHSDSTGPATEPEETPDLSGLVTVLKWLFSTVLAVAAVIGQYRLRRQLRRKRCQAEDPNTRALALWQEALTLHRLLKEAAPQHLKELAQKAKFSQYALRAEELSAFAADIRDCVSRLEAESWYKRLLHRLIFAAY